MMRPKIDYALIGAALTYYDALGYRYVEVPWLVSDYAIRMTLPEGLDYLQLGVASDHEAHANMLVPWFKDDNALVGSAEQGFLTMALEPGRYVGVTPCFRCEEEDNLLTQTTFMKVELFDNRSSTLPTELLNDAWGFFTGHVPTDSRRSLRTVVTAAGTDINLGGTEIGSYGERTHDNYGRWCYGTGLALPRFSVARALAEVF